MPHEGLEMTLLQVFVALWGLVGSQISVVRLETDVRFTDLYGVAREAPAALACPDNGRPVLYLGPRVDLETLVHELAHARDCVDDGALNASPIGGARPAARPDWASDYCWNADAEWYACWVVQSRSLDAPVPASVTATGTEVTTKPKSRSLLARWAGPLTRLAGVGR